MTDEITDRLSRLEAEIRRWRWVAIAAGALAIAALAFALRTLRTPTELQIAGDGGAKVILRADNLTFWDGKGSVTAGIDTEHHFGRLTLNGEAGVSLQVAANTLASINLNAKGAHNGALSVGEHSAELSLSHGMEHASLETTDDRSAALQLGGADTRGSVTLTDGGTAYPRLQLTAKGAAAAVALEADPKGANIRIDDGTVRRTLTTTP